MADSSHKLAMWLTSLGSVAFIAAIVVGADTAMPSKRYALNTDCEVVGFIDSARAVIAPEAFWNTQVKIIDAEIKKTEFHPEQWAAVRGELDKAIAKTDAMIEDIHQKHPSTRPSPAAEAAEALRKQADAIEEAEADRMMFEVLRRRATELLRCRPKAVAKVAEYRAE